MSNITDKDILEKFRNPATKEAAFGMLVNKYQEKLYWHIRRIVVSHDDANDVCQNMFIKVWRNLDKFKENSKLYTWLYRIATNESLTFVNKRKRKSAAPLETEDYDLSAQLKADPYFDGDEVLVEDLRRAAVEAEMAILRSQADIKLIEDPQIDPGAVKNFELLSQ